ncbi:MAG TPA: hypothetical protein DIC19_00210 [Erysipelotrichaceae bacterium]|nr:hypothetical protein [Erysipelotrichaceae bacterium]
MNLLIELNRFEQFTPAEREVVEYIKQNPKDVLNMSIERLSSESYASPSTIVRMCRKVRTKGYADFKIQLAKSLESQMNLNVEVEENIPIKREMSTSEMMLNILHLHHQALIQTINTVDEKVLENAADAIHKADVISVFGIGNSLVVAEELHYKMRVLGIPVVSHALLGFDTMLSKRKGMKQVAIVISVFGKSIKVRNWMKFLKSEGYTIIYITCNRTGIMRKLADHTIVIDNKEERTLKMGAFASRTAMMYVTDCLYLKVFQKDYDANIAKLHIMAKRTKETDEYLKME